MWKKRKAKVREQKKYKMLSTASYTKTKKSATKLYASRKEKKKVMTTQIIPIREIIYKRMNLGKR